MEKFDVIIVGAGPGGLRCAEILSKTDKKVLLLEKNPEIGPKVCAGGLTRKSVRLLNIPDEILEHTTESCIFNAPGIKTKLEFGKAFGYTVSREKLGQWQLEKIKNTGVEVRTEAEVIEITKNSIKLKTGEVFEYEYLVGADGSNSAVRKFLEIPTRKMGVAFQYMIEQKFPDVEFFLDSKRFSIWYSWILPRKDCTSVGFGCYPKLMPMNIARENFEKWAGENKIDISKSKFEAFPINCDYRGFHFGNVFLIGDAAGLVSTYTGEGIYQALASGEEVANIILNPEHKQKKIKEIRREVLIHHIMLIIVFLFGPLRNQLFNFVTYCVRNKFLAKSLARILT